MIDALATLAVVGSGIAFIAFAQVASSRAVTRRGATVRVAVGISQWLPYFFWVPYVIVAFRVGPALELPDLVRLVGVLLTIGGVALSLWSIATLGRHYDLVLEIHADHQLVRRGPFAWVRHPVYTGLALHFIGACLATGNILLTVGTLLVSFPTFIIRARAEEQLLREQFGDEYDRYAAEVPMLVPGFPARGGKR